MNKLELIIGRYDDPEKQLQDDYSFDLYRSNLAIFGSALSGKTTLIKTILMRIHQEVKGNGKEEIYILDYGNSFEKYEKLPYITAVFDALNEENVRRTFRLFEQKMAHNLRILKGQPYYEYERTDRPAHCTLIIDGLSAFASEPKNEKHKEVLIKLARDGISKGISIIFTANDTAGGISKLLSSFNRKIAFDLPPDKYIDIFSGKVNKPIVAKGRGIVNDSIKHYEFQAYFPYYSQSKKPDKKAEEQEISELIQILYSFGAYNSGVAAKKLHSFLSGDELTTDFDVWAKYTGKSWDESCQEVGDGTAIVGLDYYSFNPVSINLKEAQSIAIYGKKEFGKSNLLGLLLEAANRMKDDIAVIFLDDKRRGLATIAPIIDTIKNRNIVRIVEERAEFEKIVDLYFNQSTKVTPKRRNKKTRTFIPTPQVDPSDFTGAVDTVDEFEETHYVDDSAENFTFSVENRPFTIFVIQSRFFYKIDSGDPDEQFIARIAPCVSEAVTEKALFIFSDVQRITETTSRLFFNNGIVHAFLLDDIVRFVNDARGRSSVFSDQDPKELKENFGPCERGDGFYFNIERDELSKLKFIKCGNTTD